MGPARSSLVPEAEMPAGNRSPYCPPPGGDRQGSVLLQHPSSFLGPPGLLHHGTALHLVPPAWPAAPFSWLLPSGHSNLQALRPAVPEGRGTPQHTSSHQMEERHAHAQAQLFWELGTDWHYRTRGAPGSPLASCPCTEAALERASTPENRVLEPQSHGTAGVGRDFGDH